MLLHIVRKELLDQLLSLRFTVAFVVCAVVVVLSVIVLTGDYREAMSTYKMNTVIHRNEVHQREEVWSLRRGLTVDRPLNAMNVLVRNVMADLTESVRVQPGNRLEFPEPDEQNPVLPLFPEVDYVFIVGIIMSLLALAFSYDAVSGERESGVLKVVMSYSVPRDLLLLGKWTGGFVALVAPFTLAFMVGAVIVMQLPEVDFGPDNALAFLALLILAYFYLGAIYSLGVFVSCRTELPSTSITVLLLVWVVFILALPNVAPYITGQLAPVPSRQSVDREKSELQLDFARKGQALVEAEQVRTGNEKVWSDEDFTQRMERFWARAREAGKKIEDSYMRRVQHQTRLSSYVARLSPLTSFNLAALDLAAAGIEQETRYIEALQVYSGDWEDYATEKSDDFQAVMREARSGQREVSSEEWASFRNMDFSDYPHFDFSYMPFVDRLSLIYPDVLLLAIWNVLFFMLAYFSYLRYDVR